MLAFEKLRFSYGEKEALKGLSLSLAKGELLTLLGPSGCGKTTTLQIAGGFLVPDSGRVIIDGRDVTAVPPEERPTATVFQSHALFPHMTVSENVAYGLTVRRVPKARRRARAEEILARVGLAGFENSRVQELSGGQQQRVALARALILEPQVLLLDEPLSSLDARLRVKMRAEIRNLQQAFGITALYVTHDQEEALSISDRVAVMNAGELVQVGTPEEIYFEPSCEFVADFIGDAFPVTLDGKRILLRSDQIRISDDGDRRGVLVGRTFLGADVHWTIQWEGQKLRAALPSASEPEVRAGGEVRFSFVSPHGELPR
ncbi:MAG: ABC transporter ATP-binding protein [Pyramidobacter sp.]|jgi:iron(III) transport system ATP-binding protein